MIITDKTALRICKRLKSSWLRNDIYEYPDSEREGRCDLQFLADEISYCRSNYEEYGHCLQEALEEARDLIRETRNGKCIPMNPKTLKPQYGYSVADIQFARDVIAEYKQVQYYENRLAAKGYFGKW